MTDKRYELTRRKILASVGAVGAAGAATGLGTSAFFSDQETFSNNQLVAGELDLKVAVSQHYVDWLPDTDTENGNVFVDPPQETDDAGMPDSGETPDIRLQAGSDGEDTKARPIELVLEQDDEDNPSSGELEDQFNDRPGLEFATGSLVNTINAGTASALGIPPNGYDESLCDIDAGADDDDAERAIIQLGDVKPGDFGFIRFAFASCDNPAFVQVEGEVTDKDENGTTEPEEGDPDEEEDVVELLDEVKIALVDSDVATLIDGGHNDGDTEVDIAPGAGFAGDASTLRALDVDGGARERLSGDIDPEEGGGSSAAENDCFSAETNHYYTFVWWLPIDHANEIQSDRATFELGLYAEQCRHNDGLGNNEGDMDDGDTGEFEAELDDGTVIPFDAVESDETVQDYYDYGGGSGNPGSSANTDEQRSDESVAFVYRNTTDGNLSLVFVHDDWNDGDGTNGTVTFDISGSGLGSGGWVREDGEGGDNFDFNSSASPPASADWQWNNANTDGGALDIESTFDLAVDADFNAFDSFNGWVLVDGDGTETTLSTADDPASVTFRST